MLRYQLLFTAIISGILIVYGRELACLECDLSLMYKEWVPCQPAGGCGKRSRFALMIKGDGKAFCPTGCRCYTKEFKQVVGRAELDIKAAEEEKHKAPTEPERQELTESTTTTTRKCKLVKPTTNRKCKLVIPKLQCKTGETERQTTRRP